jgi:hypothetical protein
MKNGHGMVAAPIRVGGAALVAAAVLFTDSPAGAMQRPKVTERGKAPDPSRETS